jgi:TIR domain
MAALRDQVFISYSHKDREWLSKLQTMLKPMVRNKIISVWEDTKISAGEEWRGEIKEALARAKAAVLLVTPYFLESDFIAEHELPPLLDVAKKEGLVILWVYISHCLYDETEIKHYQAANEISKPLDSLTSSEQNRVLADVCRKIKVAAGVPNAAAENEASRAYRREPTNSGVAVVGPPFSPSTPLVAALKWDNHLGHQYQSAGNAIYTIGVRFSSQNISDNPVHLKAATITSGITGASADVTLHEIGRLGE